MDSDVAVDLTREALIVTLYLGFPVLLVGMIAGLVIGLLQALTQVQDQTIAFVPKLVAMVVALGLSLPWAIGILADYARALFDGSAVGGSIGG